MLAYKKFLLRTNINDVNELIYIPGSSGPSRDNEDDVEYRVAQSGDATCNGLFSATEGSRTMALKRGELKNWL